MIKHRCPKCSEYIDRTIIEKRNIKGELVQKRRPLYYPIKDEQGKFIWKNLFRIDAVSIGIVLAIVFLSLGVKEINKQCFEIVESPCTWAYDAGCMNCIEPTADKIVEYHSEVVDWNLTEEKQ